MSDVAAIQNLVQKQAALKQEIAKIIVGQHEVVDQIVLSIFSGGHALLVGVPGLAKTLMVNTISQALGLDFKRIQFTPDLMPSDILGSEILDENRNFKFIKTGFIRYGFVFCAIKIVKNRNAFGRLAAFI